VFDGAESFPLKGLMAKDAGLYSLSAITRAGPRFAENFQTHLPILSNDVNPLSAQTS
jgi:hypothetical protein